MKSFFHPPTAVAAVALLCHSMTFAQVLIESRPYRGPADTTPALQAQAAQDLPIAPYVAPYAPRSQAPARAAPRPAAAVAEVVVEPTEKQRRWDIKGTDGTLSRALTRLAGTDGMPILWEAPKDLPVVAASYQGSFYTVLEQVMADTSHSQYPLHACAYDNVVRVLHVSQTCQR